VSKVYKCQNVLQSHGIATVQLCSYESRSVNSLWHNRVSWSVRLVSHRWWLYVNRALQFFKKNREFSCDSSRANDGSLIKPLRRSLMMILRNVESRDVFGITKQLCTHNDKRKHLLWRKTCTKHLMVCCHNYNAYFVRLWR